MTSEYVEKIRGFNRFYTQTIGLIKKQFLDSPYSLIQARVLFELSRHPGILSKDLARSLDLDPTYLSKILKKFSHQGLVAKTRATKDSRKYLLTLTARGNRVYEGLREMSNTHVHNLVRDLSPEEKNRITAAMETIQGLLDPDREPSGYYTIRSHRPGDIGYVTHRHGVLYAQEYGFDDTFEAYVANGMGTFIDNFNPDREHLWIAETNGTIIGSVAIVHAHGDTAQLRWLFVDPNERCRGIAGKLIQEALVFARQKGYASVMLWTIDFLHAARTLYANAGFALAETRESRLWGKTLNEEKWELAI